MMQILLCLMLLFVQVLGKDDLEILNSVSYIPKQMKNEIVSSDPMRIQRIREQAENGVTGSQYLMGLFSLYGANGVRIDYPVAIYWFEQAAVQGHSFAQSNLGILYANGIGETKDISKAKRWFKKSIESDDKNIDALWMYGQLLLQNNGDLQEAVSLFKRASDLGSARGEFYLGMMFEYGLGGLPVYGAKSLEYYRRAANHGDKEALYYAAVQILYGRGVAQDIRLGSQMVSEAASAGVADAMLTLGKLYTYGQGVERDYRLAIAWFAKAIDRSPADSPVYVEANNARNELQNLVDLSDKQMFEDVKEYFV